MTLSSLGGQTLEKCIFEEREKKDGKATQHIELAFSAPQVLS